MRTKESYEAMIRDLHMDRSTDPVPSLLQIQCHILLDIHDLLEDLYKR